jgi:hypothetical protein
MVIFHVERGPTWEFDKGVFTQVHRGDCVLLGDEEYQAVKVLHDIEGKHTEIWLRLPVVG